MSTASKKTLVTCGLPYSNGRLHQGHIAGAHLPADIFVRYKKLKGENVRFVCGSDDHGVPIMLSAAKEGKTPNDLSKYYSELQAEHFKGLGINFDVYSSTSRCVFHKKASQDFFLKLHEKGYFEKQVTRQFFDESKSMFLPDRFVKGTCSFCKTPDQNGDQCENCGKLLDVESLESPVSTVSGKPAVVRDTTHWFLDLSRCEKVVTEWLDKAEIRETTRAYVKGLLATGLVKRSMTRDIDWGIPVPLPDPDAKGKVLYVWFDAPIGYISYTMELCQRLDGDPEKYSDWWKSEDCDIFHFIGEDNTVFHCIIWVAMLAAEGSFNLPTGVIVNQFLNIQFAGKEAEKISKSRGTAVWIGDYLAEARDPDSLRYYLAINAPEKARAVYKPEDLVQRHNSELANTFGNFVHRIISFTLKYCGPSIPEYSESKVQEKDKNFFSSINETHQRVGELIETFQFRAALETLMEFCRSCNRYVDEKAPWTTRKTDMETTQVTLAFSLKAIYFLCISLNPFIPFATQKLARTLGLDFTKTAWNDALQPAKAGSPLLEPTILFAKIETAVPEVKAP